MLLCSGKTVVLCCRVAVLCLLDLVTWQSDLLFPRLHCHKQSTHSAGKMLPLHLMILYDIVCISSSMNIITWKRKSFITKKVLIGWIVSGDKVYSRFFFLFQKWHNFSVHVICTWSEKQFESKWRKKLHTEKSGVRFQGTNNNSWASHGESGTGIGFCVVYFLFFWGIAHKSCLLSGPVTDVLFSVRSWIILFPGFPSVLRDLACSTNMKISTLNCQQIMNNFLFETFISTCCTSTTAAHNKWLIHLFFFRNYIVLLRPLYPL